MTIAAALLLAGGAGVAAAEQSGPEELWSEYPLDPTQTTADRPRDGTRVRTHGHGHDDARDDDACDDCGDAERDRGARRREPHQRGRCHRRAPRGAIVAVSLIFFATRFLTDSVLIAPTATAKGVPAMSKLFRRRGDDETESEKPPSGVEADPETGRPLAEEGHVVHRLPRHRRPRQRAIGGRNVASACT